MNSVNSYNDKINVYVVCKSILKYQGRTIQEENTQEMYIYEGKEYYFLSCEDSIDKSIITQLEEIESSMEESGVEGELIVNETLYTTMAHPY